MTKKILLVNPQQNQQKKGTKNMYPSGALLLIGTMCKQRGHEVMIYEGATSKQLFEDTLNEFQPGIVGITVNTFQTKHANIYLTYIKSQSKDILTVIGGPHPSAIGIQSLSDFQNADIAVMGEGEYTFLDIVNDIPLDKIDGICYNGKRTPDRKPIDSLDHIPLTDLSLINIDDYESMSNNNYRSMFIMASRGCPFQCIYCNKSVFGSTVRFREPEKIIEEIKWLYNQYGITHIYFQDDTFNLKREWIDEILNLIIDNGLNNNISYMAPFRANKNLVDEDLLQLAKKANFKTIFYGVESGNQRMLDEMHKGLKIEEIKRAFEQTHNEGIQTIAAFIVGLPGENIHTIKDSINLWREIKPTYSGFTLATPFPNTGFEKDVKINGHLLNSNYNDYRCGGSYVRTAELSQQELQYYSNIAIYGDTHEWIYKLPVFTIGKNILLRPLSLVCMGLYWRLKK